MSRAELRQMNYRQLVDMRGRLDEVLVEKSKEEKLRVRGELAKIAEGHGFKLNDLLGSKLRSGMAKRHGATTPKYRNPSNPSETWSGRGRHPRWFKEETAVRVG